MFAMLRSSLILVVVLLLQVPALASDERVQGIGERFVAGLPVDWTVVDGDWAYFDVAECFQPGRYCFGTNPSSPYGFPHFGSARPDGGFQMAPNEAVVIVMRTPPEMRYYSLVQYLVDRGVDRTPVYASLGDSLNHLRISTLQSAPPGTNVFDQYAVVVWTADLNTFDAIGRVLDQQGIATSQINLIPLPVQLPLRMGYAATADRFGLLMRMALPKLESELDRYMAEKPFFVVRVRPPDSTEVAPVPTIGFADETSGVSEPHELSAALDALVSDIQAHYRRAFWFRERAVHHVEVVGFDCIDRRVQCNFDNHDALYSAGLLKPLQVSNLTDVVIVAGVNHHATGKALYLNHAVYDTVHVAGIVDVTDAKLTAQSALYHAGVTGPDDPRVDRYRDLYAIAISYECGPLQHCVPIPAPTPDSPVGLVPGEPFRLIGRSYVEPRTGVRPAMSEIVAHRVLVGTSR